MSSSRVGFGDIDSGISEEDAKAGGAEYVSEGVS
jgi:hypothetical protein